MSVRHSVQRGFESLQGGQNFGQLAHPYVASIAQQPDTAAVAFEETLGERGFGHRAGGKKRVAPRQKRVDFGGGLRGWCLHGPSD